AGRGPQREELERLAADLGLRRLRFAGFVPDAELPSLVQGAIAAVVPSEVFETFGYAAYEAMAVGRPVVASRIGPLPELIQHGETGLLFDPGDPEGLAMRLSLLNEDRDRAHRMGRAARAFVEERNDVDRHYERLLQIYRRAMERSSPAPGAVR
ncbi:MAG: glycosyltransferase family 4 protein, partial [Candidatus Dormibacteraeota bacterium]|nr:glycosyltransferase family 4 protein [Candidatus Dormibacteraeota bacterium]